MRWFNESGESADKRVAIDCQVQVRRDKQETGQAGASSERERVLSPMLLGVL